MLSKFNVMLTTMDSDDEWQANFVYADGLRHRALMQRLMPTVYDIRGKNTLVSGKAYKVMEEPDTTNSEFLKSYFASKLGVLKNLIYIRPGENRVVIHDDSEDIIILFIMLPMENQYDQYEHPFHYINNSVACIGIKSNTSVSDLEQKISGNARFRTGKSICLFLKDRRLDMSTTLASLLKNGDSISCVQKREETVHCFHLPRPNIENKYSISCFNTDTVGEMKEVFKKTFHEVFKGLNSGSDTVYFTQGKHIVKDEEMLYADTKRRAQVKERGRLFVHIKSAQSVPVTIKINIAGKESMHHVLFICLPMTTKQFRKEASVYTDHPPNALQLYVDNKKVRGSLLSEATGFLPNTLVTIQVKKKTCLHVILQDGTSTRQLTVDVYKLDTVNHVKQIVAKSGHYDIRDIQMTFEDKEMKDEDLIQDYRIRSGDAISVRVFQDSIHLLVRQPGQCPFFLTINNYPQCTVYQLKEYISQMNNQRLSHLNIIFQNRCLEDCQTLDESGLISGNTILLTRANESDETEHEGIKSVFVSDPRGTFQEVLAVEAGGIVFYAPDSVPIHKEKMLRKTTHFDATKEIMIRKIPKQQLSIQNRQINQLEIVGYPPLHIAGQSTLNLKDPILTIDRAHDSCLLIQGKSSKLKNSISKPLLPGYHSDPEFSTLKRFTYFKELAEGKGRVVLREQSFYEEDVSEKHPDERFAISTPLQSLQSPDCSNTSQEIGIHRSPSLIFPTEAVQNSVLHAVSLELGHNWKRLALALDLSNTDIDSLEYSHCRNLHEQAFQALLLWKQRASKSATVAKLKEALKICDLALIADSINENIKYETT